MRYRIFILLITALLINTLTSTNNTNAYFTAQDSSENILFITAESFSPTPTDSPSQNPCDNINIDIHGNGMGSYNGVTIICQNRSIIHQSNETNVNTNINTQTNTGGNSTNGNTNGENNINTGSASATVIINVDGSSNSNTNNNPPTNPVP